MAMLLLIILAEVALVQGASPSPPPPSPPASPPASDASSTTASPAASSTTASSASRPATSLLGLGLAGALAVGSARGRVAGGVVVAALLVGMAAPSHAAGYIASSTVEGAVDCQVAWDAEYTPCNKEGAQSRRYTVSTYPTATGYQCPIAADLRACTYPGAKTHLVDGNSGAWGTPACSGGPACAYASFKATVGDTIVFKYAAGHDVVKLPTIHHYSECVFGDGDVTLGGSGDGAGAEGFMYVITEADRNSELLMASSKSGACANGQRVRVVVDDFEKGTLAEAVALVGAGAYSTEEEAQHLIARLWSFEASCPTSALGFYQGDTARATTRCRADAYSLLGFVFRKKPSSDATRSEKYYNEALEIHPGHCEAWSYKGELYLDQGSLEDASAAYTSLSNLAASTAASGAGNAQLSQNPDAPICAAALASLQGKWRARGWCPPPGALAVPCPGEEFPGGSGGQRAARPAAALALLLLLPLLMLARPF